MKRLLCISITLAVLASTALYGKEVTRYITEVGEKVLVVGVGIPNRSTTGKEKRKEQSFEAAVLQARMRVLKHYGEGKREVVITKATVEKVVFDREDNCQVTLSYPIKLLKD